eukprot:3464238-Amphidinium_carterae.1
MKHETSPESSNLCSTPRCRMNRCGACRNSRIDVIRAASDDCFWEEEPVESHSASSQPQQSSNKIWPAMVSTSTNVRTPKSAHPSTTWPRHPSQNLKT